MARRGRTFRIFGEGSLGRDLLDRFFQQVRPTILDESDTFILNVNETEFIEHIVASLAVEVPSIDFDGMTISNYEKFVARDELPNPDRSLPAGPFPQHAIVFRYPLPGDPEILAYSPSAGFQWSHECHVEGGDLCVDSLVLRRTPEAVRDEWTRQPERNRPWEPIGKRPMSPGGMIMFQRRATSFVNRQQRGIPFKKQQPTLPGL
jgi:hypothetical protein